MVARRSRPGGGSRASTAPRRSGDVEFVLEASGDRTAHRRHRRHHRALPGVADRSGPRASGRRTPSWWRRPMPPATAGWPGQPCPWCGGCCRGWRSGLVVEVPTERRRARRGPGRRAGPVRRDRRRHQRRRRRPRRRRRRSTSSSTPRSSATSTGRGPGRDEPRGRPRGDRGGHRAGHVPAWLTEGYADYVALRDVDLPLSVTAAQVEQQVRREGPPATLPGDARFDTRTTHLGAAYEAAWIACRMLADRAGEQALTRFYTGLRPGDDVGAEFRRVVRALGGCLHPGVAQGPDRLGGVTPAARRTAAGGGGGRRRWRSSLLAWWQVPWHPVPGGLP